MLGSSKYSMYSIASSPLFPKYPEGPIPVNYMDKVLDLLEDYSLSTYLIRCQNYQTIESILKNNSKVDVVLLRRLLNVCIHDINDGTKYTIVIHIITSLIFKQNITDWSSLPELVPLASGFLNVLKKSTLTSSNMNHLQSLCLEKLSLYPDEVLKHIPTSDMIELVNYMFQSSTCDKSLAYKLVCRFIKILPPDNRKKIIEEHLALWFLKLLPQIMNVVVSKEYSADPMLSLLETVTDTLLEIDYGNNKAWAKAFEHICTPNKYPSVLKQLLTFDNDSWLRLWIVFIKLLKQEMTSCKTKGVSPINAMLPVVETAFKMDTVKRCQAFQCWKVLIDSFSKENNETQIIKGVKLFVIPLKSNNARVLEAALAKFDTWWHLIKKFGKKVPDITDILKSFLSFCFGTRNENTQVLVPGSFSDELKKLSVQAFVEITGHVDCKGCVSKSFTRLEDTLLTGQLLNQYLSVWIHALKQTIIISVSLDDVEVHTQMKCAWKSILGQAQRLQSEDGEKVYNAILDMVLETIREQELVAKLVYDFFLISMLNDDGIKKCLTKPNTNDMHYGKRLVKLALNPALNNYCGQCDAEKVVNNLMPLCGYIIINKEMLTWLFRELGTNDCSLLMWTALIKSITKEKIPTTVKFIRTMMIWPLSHMESFNNYVFPASVWNSVYEMLRPKLTKLAFHNAILNSLSNNENQQNLFYVFAFTQLLKHSLDNDMGESYRIETSLLAKLLEKIDSFKIVEAVFPLIIGVMTSMIANNKLVNHSECILKLMGSVNTLLRKTLNSKIVDKDQFAQHYFSSLNSLIRLLNTTSITVPSFVTHSVVECAELLTDQSPKIEETYLLIKNLLDKLETTDKCYGELKRIIETRISPTESNKSPFPAPNITFKKAKKKEASIVNTVVENGEEFVVVKSNWKFNPRKLTENQKEKFQRKREDIPALYQDLSQSQEGFKLSTWRTDSQDTTTGSKSTSKGSDDFTNVFKNMPNTEVVPKIMENILADSPIATKNTEKNEKINSPSRNSVLAVERKKDVATPQEHKSPKIALKDRINFNVKSLIERCSVFNRNTKEITKTEPTIVTKKNISDDNTENNKNILSTSLSTSAIPLGAITILEIDDTDKIVKSKGGLTDNALQQNEDQKSISIEKVTVLTTPTSVKKKRGSKPNNNIEIPTPTKIVSGTEMTGSSSKTPTERPSRTKRRPNKFEPDSQDFLIRRRQSINSPLKDNETDSQNDESKLIPNGNVIEDQNKLIPQTKGDIVKEAKIGSSQVITNESQTQDVIHIHQNKDMSEARPEQTKKIDVYAKPVSKPDTKSEKNSKTKRKSRLESNLAIDMVQGHPFLNSLDGKRKNRKSDSEHIVTRNKVSSERSFNDINKSSQNDRNTKKMNNDLMAKEVSVSTLTSKGTSSSTVSSDDTQMSEDFIESSQDSTVTSTSSKTSVNKSSKVIVQILPFAASNQNKDDIELPVNKSIPIDTQDLTAEMDTEPLTEQQYLDDVIVIDNDSHITVEIRSENITNDTLQNTANADTEPVDSQNFISDSQPVTNNKSLTRSDSQNTANADTEPMDVAQEIIYFSEQNETPEGNDITTEVVHDGNGLSSPFKDGNQRNADFLNNTLELSPIKIMSPIDNEQSPPRNKTIKESYVVVKLTSPVQCNGEPFEKSSSLEDSPEVFTDDRMHLDKRDQSPPRATTTSNSSPSSSLSLKKNRPQVRAGGRAAHMLGLCVPDQLMIQKSNEQNEVRPKTVSNAMSAKRNLRIMYACTDNDVGNKNTSSDEDLDFLMLKKSVPSADSSPSGPILKRKLVEVADENTVSPASKRKRVSFHDPPVSTTVNVQKYLEPFHVRSPSSAGMKSVILNRQQMKSPKKLENFFKLSTALSKTVECFNSPEDDNNFTDDIESSSLETQSIEVVKTTDLNDTDPICSELIHCTDPISEIATELSSTAMKYLLVKELKGKVETVGDLAKMTELEVNRLRIKAPKIKVARKVLTDYIRKKKVVGEISDATTLETIDLTGIVEKASEDIQVQIIQEIGVQTNLIQHIDNFVQTEEVTVQSVGIGVKPSVESISVEAKPNVKSFGVQAKPNVKSFGAQATQAVSNVMVQTIESGSKTTDDIVLELIQRPDHVDGLSRLLGDEAKEELIAQQSLNIILQAHAKKIANTSNVNDVLQSIMSIHNNLMARQINTNECSSSLVNQYMRSHILLCSKLLKDID